MTWNEFKRKVEEQLLILYCGHDVDINYIDIGYIQKEIIIEKDNNSISIHD